MKEKDKVILRDLENKFDRNKITFSDRFWKHIDRILNKLHLNPYP